MDETQGSMPNNSAQNGAKKPAETKLKRRLGCGAALLLFFLLAGALAYGCWYYVIMGY